MDVNNLKTMDTGLSYSLNKPLIAPTSIQRETTNIAPAELFKESSNSKDKNTIAEPKIEELTEAMNKFMQYVNADLQFSLHKETNTIIVQMVDVKKDKVIKEFPSHEFLDTVAKIREFVGTILDKKV